MITPQTDQMTSVFTGKRITVDIVPMTNESSSYNYEIVRVRNAVAILPVFTNSTKDNEYLLLKHYRLPVFLENNEDQIIEACAGVIDDTDDCVLEAAQRELKEETGYVGGNWKYCGYCFASPGISTEKIFLYLVYDPTSGSQELEESEKGMIELYKISKAKAIRLVQSNQIVDMKTSNLIMREAMNKLQWGMDGDE